MVFPAITTPSIPPAVTPRERHSDFVKPPKDELVYPPPAAEAISSALRVSGGMMVM